MTNKDEIKKILKDVELGYKAICTKTDIIIFLGYSDAPPNYKKYEETEAEQLMYLLRNYNPIINNRKEFGFNGKEIRIKQVAI